MDQNFDYFDNLTGLKSCNLVGRRFGRIYVFQDYKICRSHLYSPKSISEPNVFYNCLDNPL